MRIQYLRFEAVDRMADDVRKYLDWYRAGGEGPPYSSSDLLDSHLVAAGGNLPSLMAEGDQPLSDTDAAIQFFEWMPALRRDEARDPRLWTALAHCEFSAYCRARWSLAGPEKRQVTSVRQHWFVQGEGLASLRRHTLARLWWAVELTRAPWEKDQVFEPLRSSDPYIFSRVLLGNQDVYQALVERKFGSESRILIPALEAVRQVEVKGVSAGNAAKVLGKQINLVMRYRRLAELSVDAQLHVYLAALA